LRSPRSHLRDLGHAAPPALARLCRISVVLDCRSGGSIHTVMLRPPSNHAMERTATRRAFTFRVTCTPSLRPTRAPGGRRSSYSR
jgi:hypothetical protein